MTSLNKKMASGVGWMVLFKFAQRGLGLVSTVILARILVPEDFGLIAMALSVYAVLEIMGAFSFDLALIQNQKATRQHYDTAWTFNLIYGVVAATILFFLADPIAIFFEETRLVDIVHFLALATLLQGAENIGVVAFRKDLNFKKEFNFLILKKMIAFTVTVSAAFVFQNYWALVAGIITSAAAGVAISYLLHPYRPRFSLAASSELFHFSKWMLLNNILVFFNIRGLDFVIGKIAGARTLGVYTLSYELSNLATTEIVTPVTRAVFPGYAKMSGDQGELRKGFLNVLSLVAVLVLPVGLGTMALSESLVNVVLGDKWLECIPLIEILAITGVTRGLQANFGAVFLAVGKPKMIAVLSTIQIVIAYPIFITALSRGGIEAGATALVITAIIVLPLSYFLIMRVLSLPVSDVFTALWRPAIAALSMVLFLKYLQTVWPMYQNTGLMLVQLLSYVTVGAILYTAFLVSLWRFSNKPAESAEAFIISFVRRKLNST